MDHHGGWLIGHLVALSAWAGLVMGEIVLEVSGIRMPRLRDAASRLHYFIDVFVEIPLLGAVVLTGAMLLASTSHVDAALWLKVSMGLGAVSVNSVCAGFVIARYRKAEAGDSAGVDRLTRWIVMTVVVGLPLGLAALWLGGRRAGWW